MHSNHEDMYIEPTVYRELAQGHRSTCMPKDIHAQDKCMELHQSPPTPPPLRRQTAAMFEWPPVPEHAWLVIGLSPVELAQHASRYCQRPINVTVVLEVVLALMDHPYIKQYYQVWQADLEKAGHPYKIIPSP